MISNHSIRIMPPDDTPMPTFKDTEVDVELEYGEGGIVSGPVVLGSFEFGPYKILEQGTQSCHDRKLR